MDCVGADRTSDELGDASTGYAPDAFPFPSGCCRLTAAVEAFVDVVIREEMLRAANDVAEVRHPMISAVVHRFCSVDLLSATLMIPVEASCAVIVDALKLVDHVRQQRLRL